MVAVAKKVKFRKSLATTLLRYIFGLYAMLTIIITITQLYFEYNHTKKAVFKDIIHFEETFKDGFAKSLWEYNRSQLDATLIGLGKVEAIAGVKITDESDNMFANIGEFDDGTKKSNKKILRQVAKTKVLMQIDYLQASFMDTLFGYEFKLYKKSEDPKQGTKLVGIGVIYSSQKILLQKIQYGFFLILVNSLIKTMGLWIIFIVITRMLVTKPLEKFSSALFAMNTKNPSKDANITELALREDELGMVAKAFDSLIKSVGENIVIINDLNENLEEKVKDRTTKLAEKTKDVQIMLENLSQGIFTIKKDGTVHHEYSKYLETIFKDTAIADANFSDLLFSKIKISASDKEQAMAAVSSSLGFDIFAYETNMHHLPKEVILLDEDNNEKILEVDWSPIADELMEVQKILVSLRDVTEIRKIHQQANTQRIELEMIGHLLSVGITKFKEFSEQVIKYVIINKNIIQENKNTPDNLKILFRNMHTIKGNARTIGLSYIVDEVHSAEKLYTQIMDGSMQWDQSVMMHDLNLVEEQINKYINLMETKLNAAADKEMSDEDELFLRSFDNMVSDSNEINAANISFLKNLRIQKNYIKLKNLLEDEIKSLDDMAKSLGKPTPEVIIEDENILWKKEFKHVLKDVMGHCFRNSIDHGIEQSDIRETLGKERQGKIFIKTITNKDNIELHFNDDGRGLNLKALAEKSNPNIDINLSSVDQDYEVANSIFMSGLSTAENVTSISGRGVGMDAVKTFIEENHGKIEIKFIGDKNKDGFRPIELKIVFPKEITKQMVV